MREMRKDINSEKMRERKINKIINNRWERKWRERNIERAERVKKDKRERVMRVMRVKAKREKWEKER